MESSGIEQIVAQINSSVRSILSERTRTNSKRGHRTDDHHLALVIESGGMRGVAAGGFIKVLSDAMLLDAFDTIHGSSAGACAAAFFLTQQADRGLEIYYSDICNSTVINPMRFFSRPCVVDTDYIVDHILAKRLPLDAEKIISEPGVLSIVSTSIEDGGAAIHRGFQNKEQILLALKATLRVPGPREPGIVIGNKHHIDGAIAAPMPLISAIGAGATHILAIGTQRARDYSNVPGKLKYLEGAALGLLYGRPLMESYIASRSQDRRSVVGDDRVVIENMVRPSTGTTCGRLTIDKNILRNVEMEAIQVASAYLAGT